MNSNASGFDEDDDLPEEEDLMEEEEVEEEEVENDEEGHQGDEEMKEHEDDGISPQEQDESKDQQSFDEEQNQANNEDSEKGNEMNMGHENTQEDDGNDGDNDDDQNDLPTTKMQLGGRISTPSFALLTGIFDDPDNPASGNNDGDNQHSTAEILKIPITRLPAILGRTHDTKNPNFFGLGKRKVLSRQHFIIYYCDVLGNRYEGSHQLRKVDAPSSGQEATKKKLIQEDDDEEELKNLAEKKKGGYFCVESLGKNRIFVNGRRVDQGQVALLENGSKIKMNFYQLVFLLPTDAVSETIQITNNNNDIGRNKNTTNTGANSGTSTPTNTNTKKRKKPSPSTATSAITPALVTSSSPPPQSTTTTSTKSATAAWIENLEVTPVKQLLIRFFEAIDSGLWERKHQMMGGAITLHAVRDAARAPSIQAIAAEHNGISRSEVMDWIKNSPRYRDWNTQILFKMEMKSYQANVTKCMWKSGFQRNAPVGRFVRWKLPPLELLGPGEPMSEGEEEEEDAQEEQENEEQEEQEENNEGVFDDAKEDEQEQGTVTSTPKARSKVSRSRKADKNRARKEDQAGHEEENNDEDEDEDDQDGEGDKQEAAEDDEQANQVKARQSISLGGKVFRGVGGKRLRPSNEFDEEEEEAQDGSKEQPDDGNNEDENMSEEGNDIEEEEEEDLQDDEEEDDEKMVLETKSGDSENAADDDEEENADDVSEEELVPRFSGKTLRLPK